MGVRYGAGTAGPPVRSMSAVPSICPLVLWSRRLLVASADRLFGTTQHWERPATWRLFGRFWSCCVPVTIRGSPFPARRTSGMNGALRKAEKQVCRVGEDDDGGYGRLSG